MKMGVAYLPKNPLDLADIRNLVASFLDRKGCLACMLLDKYNHCIRQDFSILIFDHVKALQHPKLNSFMPTSVINRINPYNRSLELDIIHRNNATLIELEFNVPPTQSDNVEVDKL
ncbi:hypothetical protein BG015_002220 [Linnemannia schmuckeri]|uniref:Uncharacterized protein n=1 Tax=Linnemannia schmuckeri TaxID=64567 RepID=A0A9P5S5U6_9FUNG|nr:hypothetical protein BG015_002220 [Linnemannia schmuckeri]